MADIFSSTLTNYLANSMINNAEFIKVKITNPDGSQNVYAMSNSYKTETIVDSSGTTQAVGTFTSLGGLVGVSSHQRDLSASAYDTQIGLVGIDPTKIKDILQAGQNSTGTNFHSGLKGAQIEVFRGFYDTNYNLIETPELRYTGIVTSYTIKEDRQAEVDTFTLQLNCSSYKTVLENRTGGRHTNGSSWNGGLNPYLSDGVTPNPDYDTSMDRVQAIHDATYNFGIKLA